MTHDYWADYGYRQGVGDPWGMTPMLPVSGMVKALLERQQPLGGEAAWERIRDAEVVGYLSNGLNLLGESLMPMDDPARVAAAIDIELQGTLRNYANHLSDTAKMWTWGDLCDAMEKGSGCGLVMPYDLLTPHLSAVWARQRYIGINLLRRLRMDVEVEMEQVTGGVHTGVPSSTAEAHQAALDNARTTTATGTDIRDVRVDIYGPSHGWRDGSYCCDVDYCMAIRPLLPEGVTAEDVTLEVQAVGDFDSLGTGLQVGSNALRPDKAGWVRWPDKRPDKPHPLPVHGHDVTSGWTGRCQIDTRPAFHFYHDVDYLF